MLIADISLIFDPVYPWSMPGYGWLLLFVVVGLVAGATVLTYLVQRQVSFWQFLTLLALRLGALLVVLLLMVRPAVVEKEMIIVPSKLLILIDSSQSMSIRDESKKQTRWERGVQILQSPSIQKILDNFRNDQQVEVVFYQADEKVEEFDSGGIAEGQRTNVGLWLLSLLQRHGKKEQVQGLLLLSDGANNDSRYSALEIAKRWKGVKVPLHTFGLGDPTTGRNQRDIFFASQRLNVPSSVPIKTRLKVKGLVDAPGFTNAQVTVRLFFNDKEVEATPSQVVLPDTEQKKFSVEVEADAPMIPGEYKVTLKIDPLRGEVNESNNELSSYFTATKEGLSVLWVEGKIRAFEPTFAINYALLRDPNIRVIYTERLKESKLLSPDKEDWYNLEKRPYDVIVIGDISGSRFAGNHPEVFAKIRKMVESGTTGLLMLGGYETFANSDWHNYPDITNLLPVKVEPKYKGQIKTLVRMLPTQAGLDHYLLQLVDGNEDKNRLVWEGIFDSLDGMVPLEPVEGATVLAKANGKPIMVMRLLSGGDLSAEGRVIAFGADTTWKAWRRKEALKEGYYERFWQQLIRWLAHQENLKDTVWVELDTRRLPANSDEWLDFSVGLRSPKTRKKLKNGTFQVKVIGPDKKTTEVPTYWDKNLQKTRGSFQNITQPGEYKVVVQGAGKDEEGNPVKGKAEARFLAYAVDIEALRVAADHEFLKRLAKQGGGQFRPANEEEFGQLLQELTKTAQGKNQQNETIWPEWSKGPRSEAISHQLSSLWSSGMLVCFVLFCVLLCLEWYLRRRWRMV